MNARLRVATVGSGYFSQFHYNAWQRLAHSDAVELIAICSLDRAAAQTFADSYGIDSIYEDFETMLDEAEIDLVDIVTPPDTHDALIRAAVTRDIAVICQKPFTRNLDEATDLVEYIKRCEGRVFVHENFRFQPWYGKLKSLATEGTIGTPYQVSFRLRPGDGQGTDAYLDRQPYFRHMSRFLVHETAIHFIDSFRYLFGEVTSVFARIDRLNPAISGEDRALIVFEFDNGMQGLFDGNRLVDHRADNQRLTMGEMTIEGSGGCLALDGNGLISLRRCGSGEWNEVAYDWNDTDFGGDCVYLTNRHIVEHFRDGTPAANSAEEYLVNLRIEEAIYESAHSGRRIDLDAG